MARRVCYWPTYTRHQECGDDNFHSPVQAKTTHGYGIWVIHCLRCGAWTASTEQRRRAAARCDGVVEGVPF